MQQYPYAAALTTSSVSSSNGNGNGAAAELIEDIEFYTSQLAAMAQTEAKKPPAAQNVERLNRIAREVGEVYELLRLDGHN